MTIEIRPARPEEYDEVGELTVAAYRDDGFVTHGPYLDVLRDTAGRATATEVVVAVDDLEVVGTVTLVAPDAPPDWRERYRDGAATIRMLAVARSARGRGIGTALTQWCIDESRRRGWREITLLTQPEMATAQNIYVRLGFVREPGLDKDVGDGVVLMGFSMSL
jgi:predicted N-acetyltransferase YhbS